MKDLFRLDESHRGASLSHGTLRTHDLINAFEGFIEQNTPRSFRERVWNERPDLMGRAETVVDEDWDLYLNEGLFPFLEEIAPEGTYFGAHPGDGSDFGFWGLEDDPAYAAWLEEGDGQ